MVKSLYSLSEVAERCAALASGNHLSVSDVPINSLDGALDWVKPIGACVQTDTAMTKKI